MGSALEDLRILREAETIADDVWTLTASWDNYAKNVMGRQLCRAVDSIGANIAEAFGRYHYGEKIRFLYYARGSLFETKYWLNRAHARDLISSERASAYSHQLNKLGRQLNQFVNHLKTQQREKGDSESEVRESAEQYRISRDESSYEFLTQEDLDWLRQSPSLNPQSPISNL